MTLRSPKGWPLKPYACLSLLRLVHISIPITQQHFLSFKCNMVTERKKKWGVLSSIMIRYALERHSCFFTFKLEKTGKIRKYYLNWLLACTALLVCFLILCSNFSLLILFKNTNRFLLDAHFPYLLSLITSFSILCSGMWASSTVLYIHVVPTALYVGIKLNGRDDNDLKFLKKIK